jgi:hypothetical protein
VGQDAGQLPPVEQAEHPVGEGERGVVLPDHDERVAVGVAM